MGNVVSILQVQECGLIPEKLENGVLYIPHDYKTAIHLCACGCGLEVVTPLSMWTLSKNGTGEVTIDPSIGNFSFPCKSHYWIRDNKIVWA